MSDINVRMTLTDNVSSKMRSISSAARSAQTQLSSTGKALDNAFKSSAPNTFASEVSSAMGSAQDSAESLGDALDSAFSGFDRSASGVGDVFTDAASEADEFAESATQAGESIDDVSEAAEGLEESMSGVGDGADNFDDLSEGAKGAGSSMDAAKSKAIDLTSALKTLFAAVSAAAIVKSVGSYVSDSIDVGTDYTSMMSEVQAISGADAADAALMESTAREYGATTVFSATEAAEALKYMSLAGWDANQSVDALGGVLDLAAASGMELGSASDMVTDYLSAFGMEASDATYFADMLAYAQSNSNTTVEQLGEAYKNSAAMLNAAGQDVETTTSLLEAMANQGYKGSEAGTALAAVMRDITNNMDDGAIKIGDASVSVQDANGNFRDLTDILTDVEAATYGMGDAEKSAALSSTFTSDSMKAVNMVLAEGMDTISGYEDALRSASGTASEMADTMNDNLAGDKAALNSAWEELELQTFEAIEEPLRELTQYATETIVPTLTEWVPEAFESIANGATKIGNAIQPMLETILKNPSAVANTLTSLGGAFVAMKGVNTALSISDSISKAGGLGDALSGLSSKLFGSNWALGAAAVVAAVGLISTAVNEYNKLQINGSLEANFGNIELDESQIEDFASRVINADWIVNINTALGHFENADELAEEAEAALSENDALEWKARVGIELTPDEQESYTSNIETFVESKISELEERTYAAELTVSTMLTSPEGESLADSISEWAAEDMADLSTLQAQLTNLVETALTDGIIDVNEQAAIDILQSKINSILSGWKSSEAEAEMDLITQQYGRLSGKDLTSDTFLAIVDALGEQRQTAAEALEADSLEFYEVINGLVNSGRLTESEGSDYKEQFVQAVRNAEASSLVNSLQFESNTLSDTYGEKLNENYANIQESTSSFLANANSYLANGDYSSLMDSLTYGYNSAMTGTNFFSDADQKALSKLYESMAPDVAEMSNLIDEYRTAGQAIPEEVMTAFNEAMEIGAAAGDVDAAWQVFANEMVADPANEALIQAIEDGTVNVPDELREALEIATAETTSDLITIDGMSAEISNLDTEVDEEKVQALLDASLEGLEATGTVSATGDVEFEVTAGQTMTEIANQVGIAVDELIAANPQIENPDMIYVGQKINIPADKVDVDASGIGEAVNEAAESEAGDTTVETDTTVITDTTYVAGETDTSQVEDTATEQLSSGTAEQEIVTDTTYVAGETDTSQVEGATEDALGSNTVESDVVANVTSEMGTENFSATAEEFATTFQSALTSAFNKTFTATTNAVITVNYSLANPSATVTFSDGGTGTATVSASLHASGGIFDEPHLGMVAEAGPEAIIPLDGSSNAFDLWQQAGNILGVLDDGPVKMTPAALGGEGGSNGGEEKSSKRTVDININGNGTIRTSGGLSKEDVVEVLMERAREVFVNIVEEEALVGGDASYEF